MRLSVLCLLAFAVLPPASRAQTVPVFVIMPGESTIKFDVEASVAMRGKFDFGSVDRKKLWKERKGTWTVDSAFTRRLG